MEIEHQQELLRRWYELMKDQDRERAVERKEKIDSAYLYQLDPDMKSLYDLLIVRYHLMCEDLERAADALADVGPVEEDCRHWLNYYYYFFRGIYHYDRQEYKAAIENYLKAERLVYDISLGEIGEFFYKLASAYHRTYKISLSIRYTEKALEVFKKLGHYARISDCESLLGVNNKDIEQYKEAEKYYHDALIHAAKTQRDSSRMLIYLNFGALYSEQNDPETAISYLNKAEQLIELQENQLKVRLLYLLAKNYFKTEQTAKAQSKMKTGLVNATSYGNLIYYHRFSLLKAKYLERAQFEELYMDGISYYCAYERWELIIEYSEELAAHCREVGKFQKACEYYDLAIMAKNKIEKGRALSYD
ncbi:MAG TPA: tetratricopeptide repeat protein [Bacillales bacterium]|nr:tetratricopeptide repeat protein [Bacillales bacterium]